MRLRRLVLLLALSICCWLMLVGPAVATVVTVGQLAPVGTQTTCLGGYDWVQPTVAGGTSYAVPGDGTITSWSTNALAGAGQSLTLKVYRPVSASTYMVVAHDGPRALTASGGLNTFSVDIPVQAGDLIGLHSLVTVSCAFGVTTGDTIDYLSGDLADGSTGGPFSTNAHLRLNVSATLAPVPGITALSPTSGPTVGGTAVTITGRDFTGATAVSFGGAPAKSFTVNSDSSITAVSPASTTGTVDVTVTTAGGQSPASAADKFVYLPPPAVSSVSPSRGPRTGGTSVTITGHGFTAATAVSFGGAEARSFKVNSDSSITALSPARTTGTVHVVVSTRGGSNALSAGDEFTFVQVCVVPKLMGKNLKAAKHALKMAGCRLGSVKGPKTGKAKHQSRKPKTILRAGTKVNVKLD
jgi:hypothetical protein